MSSGRIRQQIGVARSRLEEVLEEEVLELSELATFNADDTQQALEDTWEDIEKLQRRCDKIQELHNRWTEMMQSDPAETDVRNKYIGQYGDYMESLQQGKNRIRVLKEVYSAGLQQLKMSDESRLVLFSPLEDMEMAKDDGKQQQNKSREIEAEKQEQRNSELTEGLQRAAKPIGDNGMDMFVGGHAPVSNQFATMPMMVPQLPYGHITLPQMSLPKFSGDITTYYEFRESFESIMGSLRVDDLTKLHYLKSVVSGEAEELIKYLQTTHANYAIAVNMLEEQYGGKERIQHVLLQKLREIPDVLSSNTDAAGLQSFVTKATSIFNQLLSLGLDMDNISTADIIKCKLPKRVIAKIYGVTNMEIPRSAKDLLKKVREISRAESLVAAIYNKNTDRNVTTMAAMHNQHHHHHQNNNHRQGNGYGMAPQSQQSRQKVIKPCAFCVEDRMRHHPQNCRKFATVELRKNRIRELRLCFRCLMPGHSSRQCTSKWKCYSCKGNHHEAICTSQADGGSHNNQQRGGAATADKAVVQPVAYTPNNSNSSSGSGFHGGGVKNTSHSQQQPGQQTGGYQRKPSTKPYLAQRSNFNSRTQTTLAVDEVGGEAEEESFIQMAHSNEEVVVREDADDVQQTMEIAMQEKLDVSTVLTPPVIMMSTEVPIIDYNGKEHLATCFFDSGSNTSYIRKDFAEKLQLQPTGTKKLNVSTFANSEKRRMQTSTFDVRIKTKHAMATVQLCSVDNIASNIVTADVENDVLQQLLQDQFLQLKRTRKDVDILIGLDSYMEVLGQVNTLRLANGLQLHITDVGPIVAGKEQTMKSGQSSDVTFSAINKNPGDEQLQQLVKTFWDLESIGIIDKNPKATIDEETQEFFLTTTTRNEDGRYVVRLPYANKDKIVSNRQLSFFRLQGNLKKLRKVPGLLEQYSNTFKEHLQLGFIELVPNEFRLDGSVLHYLAHHPVFKESSKSTKMRIVFDGSAKASKTDLSLNEHLHTGTNLLPDIAACLLRMRKFVILISADIQKAFLQLELNLEDRDATRFLWVDDEGKIICYRFKRVPFGLKSSPYLLNATIRLHLSKQDNLIAKQMIRSTYVDNVYVGVMSVMEAKKFYHESKDMFAEAKMNLTQYFSNSSEANEFFAEQEQSETEGGIQKLLGVKWDTTTDEFIFCFPTIKAEAMTKRKALKIIASVYDPLGFLTPTTLYGKWFFKLLTEAKMSWDEMLSTELEAQWNHVLKQWSGTEWRLQRRIVSDHIASSIIKMELHVFTDASQSAYGAVAYIRLLTESDAQSHFLMSKSRVAPSNPRYTIPQLEMLAVLTGVRLADYIHKEMDYQFDQTFLWTDSMCSLDTLKTNGTSGSRFVRNRVQQIQELSDGIQFSHVRGKDNPADLLTRGCPFEDLKTSITWRNGAWFLQENKELPIRQSSMDEIPAQTVMVHDDYQTPIDPYRFETFHRMLRTVMIIVYFITRGKIAMQEQVTRARTLIFRCAQLINPPTEETIMSLRLRKNKEGIWTFRGRVHQKELVFLPPKVGDVVLIEFPSLGRTKWPMGRIMEVKDRSAIVKNGSTKRLVEYPWKALFPLETDFDDNKDQQKKQELKSVSSPKDDTSEESQNPAQTTRRRSPRIANMQLVTMAMVFMTLCANTTNAISTTEEIPITSSTVTTTAVSTSFTDSLRIGIKVIGKTSQIIDWIFGTNSDNLLEWVLFFAVLYVLFVCFSMVQVIMTIGMTLFGGIKKIFQGIWLLLVSCGRCANSSSFKVSVVLFFIILQVGSGCNEIASIQATENVCQSTGNGTSCALNTISILNIRPNESIGCFKVHDKKNRLDAFVEVQATAIVSTCIQRTQHFSRDFEIEMEHVHRCWRAGSCYDEVCEKLKRDDDLPELSSTAKRAPGYSRCYKTCGCITCGGCFYCSPSCVFTRIFAVPLTKTIYEVITCPAWKTTIELNINVNGKHFHHRVDHGIPLQLKDSNISVVVTGFSTPPTPFHGATFVKRKQANGETTFGYSYTPTARPGAPSKGLIGEFQCATLNDAENFRCVFDENLCKCSPSKGLIGEFQCATLNDAENFRCVFDENLCKCFLHGTSMNCDCTTIRLKSILEKDKIPTKEAGIEVDSEKGEIITKLSTSSLVSVQLQFKNHTAQRVVKPDQCHITEVKLEGCYSCGQGAKLSYKCKSLLQTSVEGTIKCPTLGINFVECTLDSSKSEKYLEIHTMQRSVNDECILTCGMNESTFEVKGDLEELQLFDSEAVQEKFAVITEQLISGDIIGNIKDAIGNAWDGFIGFIGKWTFFMGIGMVFIFIICNLSGIGFLGFFGRECRSGSQRPLRYRRKRRRRLVRDQ
ncbi:hypothetical protein B9Z55_028354 [Caenorhabditis nigoni]|uniref:CCHC-type domain-containing protein n=1 Tax=Caenorhabditis nigoni TaxID=1611254 RepID=A0A2G5SC22_9PELO|nr:hypothetical protein B9Z55_028354 [Caenorhabditis nigoni]